MTELLSYVNADMPLGYQSYHLDMSCIRADTEVKALKKAIKKRKKDENKLANQGKKDGTEDIDIFGDD
jgi:hypothetical protein